MIRLAFIDEYGLPDGHTPDEFPTGGKRRTPAVTKIPT
jgi:hypothetical protein